MNLLNPRDVVKAWAALGPRFLPFADAATPELPLPRLLRLALFQVSVGMAAALVIGTLNRVMIVELKMSAWLVALMIALPILVAPFRALIGHKSDTHRSALGWRRVPYIWYGTMLQFAGFAIMPFALLVLTDAPNAPAGLGPGAAALAFLLVGAGMHTTQTAGLALATDLAPEAARPRVVALLYVMLLVGMLGAGLVFGALLADFTAVRLIQVVQGAAAVTVVLNAVALWKQEPRRPRGMATPEEAARERRSFAESWRLLRADPRSARLLLVTALGAFAFSMQDVLIEPYGGEILGLSVSATTILSALMAAGMLGGLALAARLLAGEAEPARLTGLGLMAGVVGFSAVIFAAPFEAPLLFRIGAVLIGFGGGLFVVCTLVAAMDLAESGENGIALGAWGATQATSAGLGIALGGAICDLVKHLAVAGRLGEALNHPATGYSAVYHLEILLLFVALAALGPLVRVSRLHTRSKSRRTGLGLAEYPG